MHTWTTFQQASGRRVGLLTATFTLLSFLGTACDSSPGGPPGDTGGDVPTQVIPGDYGGECKSDGTCEDGTICHLYATDTEDAFCTLKCASDEDCPQDGISACLSVTTPDGLVQICVPNDLCIDPDGDGYGSGPACKGRDCDQSDPNIHPGANEYCNGLDDNCNGLIDDSPVDVNMPCPTGQLGVCAEGWTMCQGGSSQCAARIFPNQRPEICDGLDNDCDGQIDEGPPGSSSNDDAFDTSYVVGIGLPCGSPESACFGGYQFCNSAEKRLECDAPVETLDIPDYCDNVDNNCNGLVDEDANDPQQLLGTPCSAGTGSCEAFAVWICNPDDPQGAPICPAVPADNAQPEICNYVDDNCNGVDDEDFKNAEGAYHTLAHCGTCYNDCNARWDGNPAAKGLSVVCQTDGDRASCVDSCLPNRFELDNDPSNGCEFEPDAGAIYVATSIRGGSDAPTCGSFQSPCLTINFAVSRAKATSKQRVRVSEGVFTESLKLENGISILGGHSSRNWLLDPSSNITTLQGQQAFGNHVVTLLAENISATTEFSGFTVDAGDAGIGGNSYGIYVSGSGSNLTIRNNVILAGRGGVGTGGTSGNSGASAGDGQRGHDRVNNQADCVGSPILAGGAAGTSTCGSTNYSGGQGANITACPSQGSSFEAINTSNGRAQNGFGQNAGEGGQSTVHTYPGSYTSGVHACRAEASNPVMTAGTNGTAGNHGARGAAPSNNAGSIVSGHWVGGQSGNGSSGTHGSGGGGGGSSGGLYDNESSGEGTANPKVYHYGPTGGGGGGGGCGGTGGSGARAGGGSFGIFVHFSGSTSNVPSIRDNTITREAGGTGGQGGAGGAGGSGGSGGEGGIHIALERWARCGAHAARGGSGGSGGHGGGGAGGTGGASFAIATGGNSNAAVNVYGTANTFTQTDAELTGGAGGAGGSAIVNPGQAGLRGASGNFRRF